MVGSRMNSSQTSSFFSCYNCQCFSADMEIPSSISWNRRPYSSNRTEYWCLSLVNTYLWHIIHKTQEDIQSSDGRANETKIFVDKSLFAWFNDVTLRSLSHVDLFAIQLEPVIKQFALFVQSIFGTQCSKSFHISNQPSRSLLQEKNNRGGNQERGETELSWVFIKPSGFIQNRSNMHTMLEEEPFFAFLLIVRKDRMGVPSKMIKEWNLKNHFRFDFLGQQCEKFWLSGEFVGENRYIYENEK